MKFQFPESSDFPSKRFFPLLEDIVFNIAPEKYENIVKDTDEVQLIVTDNNEWDCKASPDWRVIFISRKAIEVTWALCYGYFKFYTQLCNGIKPNGQVLSLKENINLDAAVKLISWAFENLTDKQKISEIPQGIPSIGDTIQKGSDEHAILEITSCTIAFFIHHELAHINLNDVKFDNPIGEEWACDKRAIDLILSDADEEEFNKRAYGISVGLLLINGIGTETRFYDGIEHPFAYDRLFINLKNHIDKENDKIWGWVVAILSLQMTNVQIPQPNIIFDNFYQCAEKFRDLLEKHSREQ